MRQSFARFILAVCVFVLALTGSAVARAQSTIKQPRQRTLYSFEAEPHVVAGLADPPGLGAGTGLGVGFRGTVELLDNGFIPKLNNSVGIGFGIDYLRYDGWQGPRDTCEEFATAPSGVPVCVRTSGGGGGGHVNYFYLPIVLQWNFWLHKRWSVFGEPGLALYLQDRDLQFTPLVLFVGGRYHLNDRITLTMRVGYPAFSFGVSFLL
ncbi:MAG TPA: hypothetical protein VHP33_26775 [Polyangiaceae bacterium]|nr:hypothetical protein [Polyangiaceae bacterium]